jgi:hypothetical protein
VVAFNILKVVYAPHKAFKEIVQKPKYYGPILIMILSILVSVGSEYARESKLYVQETQPNSLDVKNPNPWIDNITLWISNAQVSNNTKDYVYYQSIQFQTSNATRIWIALNNIGPVDCSSAGGYENLTLALKWIHPNAKAPQNVSLHLNSTGAVSYFYRNLTAPVAEQGNNTWGNMTIPLGPNAVGWLNSSSQAAWNDINGLRLQLDWAQSDRSNLTVLVDKLFFLSDHFDQSLSLSIAYLHGSNVASLITADVLEYFVFNWVLFTIAFFIAARIFHVQAQFKTLFIIIGYSLIGMVILNALFSLFYVVMPPLYFYLDKVRPEYVFENMYWFLSITGIFLPVWPLIIMAVAAHVGFDLPWRKSVIMAVIAFLPYYVLRFLLGA